MKNITAAWFFIFVLMSTCRAHAEEITVYAAASLNNSLQTIAAHYQKNNAVRIKTAFASTAVLAKQIEAGAPADIFASADTKWMDYLQARKLIAAGSRRDLLGNSVVLIAPAHFKKTEKIIFMKNNNFILQGRVCMADSRSVPAGIYGKQALQFLGWWPALEKKIISTSDVRAALAFVERGECAWGIVYATDARISTRVRVAGTFPAAAHDAVIYPFALLPNASGAAKDFFNFLQSPHAQKIFWQHGFLMRAAQ